MCRSLGLLRDVLLRHCDTTYFGPAILRYVNGGIGNDGKANKTPSNLATKRSRVNHTHVQICIDMYMYICIHTRKEKIYTYVYTYMYWPVDSYRGSTGASLSGACRAIGPTGRPLVSSGARCRVGSAVLGKVSSGSFGYSMLSGQHSTAE